MLQSEDSQGSEAMEEISRDGGELLVTKVS